MLLLNDLRRSARPAVVASCLDLTKGQARFGTTCLATKNFSFLIKVLSWWLIPTVMAVIAASIPSAQAAPTNVDLTTFTSGNAGTRFIGTSTNANAGYSVATVGDHNGDGFEDFIVSIPNRYRAIIVMKKNTVYSEVSMFTVVSDQYFRVIVGPSGTTFGTCVGGVGDINDDGFDDVIVGDGNAEVSGRGYIGYAIVIFGVVGPFTDVVVSATWTASSIGFMLLGPATFSSFVALNGQACGVGDVNGDGVDDFAVSASQFKGTTSKTEPGVVYLIYGKKSPLTFANIDLRPANFGTNGIYFTGAAAGDFLGYSLGPAGDFNGDGIADFLIGATSYDSPAVNGVTRPHAGAVYLIHGSKTSLVTMDMSTFATGAKGVRFLGAFNTDVLGRSVSSVGDINGDGIDDIAMGAPAADPLSRNNGGIVYVIYGTKVVFTADVDFLNFAASSAGFPVYGQAESMQLSTVAPAGDINRDGVDDILVGGVTLHSRAHVVFGQKAARTTPVDTLTDDVITIYFINSARLGNALDGGKDLNGDGFPDILLGAQSATVKPEAGGTTYSSAGAAWMLSGTYLVPLPAEPSVDPTVTPSADPSATPSALPSQVPSVTPSADPSATPSMVPSPGPSVDPSMHPSAVPTDLHPSLAPTVDPSAAPSFLPSAAPSANPSANPSAAPSFAPSRVPSANPSADPSAAPSVAPSRVPSANPSVNPSAAPSVAPSADPSVNPSVAPSAAPSMAPSAVPSVNPSADPSRAPSIVPSMTPSAIPSVVPSTAPSVMPSEVPSVTPTVNPSAAPSLAPSVAPSVNPSTNPSRAPTTAPSVAPSLVPSVNPTVSPTVHPTTAPSTVPTVTPTMTPTVRPTVPAVKDYEVVVKVEQDMFFVNKTRYDAQQAAYNKTIQHTVAETTDGVTPERVTDIVVEEEEEEGSRIRSASASVVSPRPVTLKYKITSNDPAVTMATLRAQLVQAAQDGTMDARLRHYAGQFGATGLSNGTFAVPQVTNAAVQRDSSSQLTGAMIASVVIGVILALVLLVFIVCFAHKRESIESSAAPHGGGYQLETVL